MMDERLKQFAGFALALVMTTCVGIHLGEAAAMENETKKRSKSCKPQDGISWGLLLRILPGTMMTSFLVRCGVPMTN